MTKSWLTCGKLLVVVLLDQVFGVAGALVLIAWASGYRVRPQAPRAIEPGFQEDAVFIAVLAYFAAAMALSGLLRAGGIELDGVWAGMVINNGAQLCGIVACAVLAMRRLPGGLQRFLLGVPAEPDGRRAGILPFACGMLLVGIGLCPLIRDLTAWVILQIAPGFTLDEHPTLKALEHGGLSGLEVAGLWIGAAVIAPMAEEMFFRGLLQGFLAGATKRMRLAIGLSAIAFGAVHLSQPHAVPALIFLGVLLGWAYARSGMLIVPMAIHAAFNLKTLVWEAIQRSALAVQGT